MASLAYLYSVFLTLFNFSDPLSFSSLRSTPHETHKPLFVFGDSLFDAGNNQYLNASVEGSAVIWPYGETYFDHPTGRISDGRIVPDFIAQFAKLPLPPPYLEPGDHQFGDGTNFASAGAGILPETQPGTISLPGQLSNFKAMKKLLDQNLGEKATKKLLGRAVYFFSIGGNDYIGLFNEQPKSSRAYKGQYVAMVIRNLTGVLREIYDLGGRKIAFQNVAPLGCIPTVKSGTPEVGSQCLEEPLNLARLHNRALSAALKKLESDLPGFKYSIFDYYSALGDRVIHPSKYGFKNGTSACCGSGAFRGSHCGTEPYELCSKPSEYVWFDGGHTTESANLQLAHLIWNGPLDVTGPYTMKQLFGQS